MNLPKGLYIDLFEVEVKTNPPNMLMYCDGDFDIFGNVACFINSSRTN